MLLRTTLLSLALLSAAPSFAQTLDLAKSSLTFTMKQMNVPVSGGFKQFAAKVDFNPQKLDTSIADFTIETKSISLPTRDAENEARKKDWFDTARFPQARFTSTSIKSLGSNRYQVNGKLSLKGVSRDVSAPFTAKEEGGVTWIEGVMLISRLAFKIGEGSWSDTGSVADEVQLKFKMALR